MWRITLTDGIRQDRISRCHARPHHQTLQEREARDESPDEEGSHEPSANHDGAEENDEGKVFVAKVGSGQRNA